MLRQTWWQEQDDPSSALAYVRERFDPKTVHASEARRRRIGIFTIDENLFDHDFIDGIAAMCFAIALNP